MPVFPRLLSMRILFRADSFPCFYSSVFVRFGASGFPFRFRYVFSRISPDPPPASLPSSFGLRFRLPVPFSLRLFPHFARSASGYFPSLFGLALPASRSVFVTSFPAFRPVRLRLFSVFVRFGASRFRFPPPACSVPNNPSSCLAVRFPLRTARNDDADCSGGAGWLRMRRHRRTERNRRTGRSVLCRRDRNFAPRRLPCFRPGADTGRPSRVRSIRLPVAAGTAEAVRHGAVSTAQGCSVSFFTL